MHEPPSRLRPDVDGNLRVSFDVPEDVTSWVVTVSPVPGPSAIRLRQLVGPDGAVWFDETAVESGFVPASRSNVEPSWPYSLMFPSDPAEEVVAGRHEATLWIEDSEAELEVDVRWRLRDDLGQAPALAIRAWLPSAQQTSPSQLVTALEGARSILSDVPLQLLTAEQASGLTAGSVDAAALRDWLVEAGPSPDGALDLLFVDHLAFETANARGVATGVPVPLVGAGELRRGLVAVALDRWPQEPERAAELLAHELGHAFGLAHTSEADGLRHDPLGDTPECPAERATLHAGDGRWLLRAEDCDGLGGDNLMFPSPAGGTAPQRKLTADQRQLLRTAMPSP